MNDDDDGRGNRKGLWVGRGPWARGGKSNRSSSRGSKGKRGGEIGRGGWRNRRRGEREWNRRRTCRGTGADRVTSGWGGRWRRRAIGGGKRGWRGWAGGEWEGGGGARRRVVVGAVIVCGKEHRPWVEQRRIKGACDLIWFDEMRLECCSLYIVFVCVLWWECGERNGRKKKNERDDSLQTEIHVRNNTSWKEPFCRCHFRYSNHFFSHFIFWINIFLV